MEVKEPTIIPSTTRTSAEYKRGKVYILHVEDDDIDAMLTRKAVLKQMSKEMPEHDFYIDLVPSLHEALKKVNSKHYDIILLDLGLADVAGLDNLHILKSQKPDLPIIVLTGRYDSNLAVEAVADGAEDYVMKMQLGDPAFANAIARALLQNHQNRH